ncbi:MAG: hypothetical protein UY58_C0001G0001 [Candidatus Magasanikbacteria bacterium GW2011_GWA2_50_22]|uniref:Glycerophosphoryl diester phosphodiesterase membrane domain-containing protein n=1 Tax=Candidatus Magasanikbacteria bacterium GW2011_GWA2_50_22 TaxID=1619043 RepID=A0A0G1WFK6_9BACT|nr:MAG: hypothetical protein UY58_C0001G0001 [Candidatus Magasanikbacteria bacterium GW2011_GWA2_50_22]
MLIGVSELIAKTWQIYRANRGTLVPYIASFFLPPVALFLAGLAGIYISRSSTLNTATNITLLVLITAAGLFAVWNSIALTAAMGALARGQSALPWKQTFLSTRRAVWPVIFSGIVVGLIVFGGTILFVVPGIIFLVWYAFTYYRIVLDGYPGLSATLRESRQLVRGRWFDIAVRVAVPTVLFALCSAFLRGLIAAILLYAPTSEFIDRATLNLLSAAIQAAIAPLPIIAGVLLYQSAKDNPLLVTEPHS